MLAAVPTRLLLRPGCRYECHGDGTCCTNIHLLGPMSRTEAKRIRDHAPAALADGDGPVTEFHEGIKGIVLSTKNGRCVFHDDKLGCRLHALVGPEVKSRVCRHFPLGTTGTPHGVRVTLSHRCACVNVGQSRLLDEERARAVLASPTTGRIGRDHTVGADIRWRGRRTVDFDAYCEWEAQMLPQLEGKNGAAGLERLLALGARGLPPLRKNTWTDLVQRLHDWAEGEADDDGFYCTLRWAELALRSTRVPVRELPQRPWAWTFERSAERARDQERPVRVIYGEWIADMLWSMAWAPGSLYRAMADFSARYTIAKRVAERLQQAFGMRDDLAAAESIMIADTVGASDPWEWVMRRFDEAPINTF